MGIKFGRFVIAGTKVKVIGLKFGGWVERHVRLKVWSGLALAQSCVDKMPHDRERHSGTSRV